MSRILCVTAHPDDEAANFGGTVARYAEQGIPTHLVCLTGGEAARNRGGAADNAALMAMRRKELAASCAILGFASHEVWEYSDAGLPQAPFYEMVGRLAEVIRRRRPEILLSMGPEGSVTAHPDHAMAGVVATAAFHWAAHERYFPEHGLAPHQAQRLWYSTSPAQPPGFPPVWLPKPDVAIGAQAYLERKIAAFRSHASQEPLFDRVEQVLRLSGGIEMFHLAAGEAMEGASNDLLTPRII